MPTESGSTWTPMTTTPPSRPRGRTRQTSGQTRRRRSAEPCPGAACPSPRTAMETASATPSTKTSTGTGGTTPTNACAQGRTIPATGAKRGSSALTATASCIGTTRTCKAGTASSSPATEQGTSPPTTTTTSQWGWKGTMEVSFGPHMPSTATTKWTTSARPSRTGSRTSRQRAVSSGTPTRTAAVRRSPTSTRTLAPHPPTWQSHWRATWSPGGTPRRTRASFASPP